MPTLYSCRHSGDEYRITKFDKDHEVESSYLCTLTECECPAGHRHTCRHREMLPKFIARQHIGDSWLYDYDRGGWVQMDLADQEPQPAPEQQPLSLPTGVQVFGLDDLPTLHNAIADAVGKPEARIEPSPAPSPAPTIRRRI